MEYGKLSPWHPWTRIHCPPNQTIPVLGVIHKWRFTKAVKIVENWIYWFGLVWYHHTCVSCWFVTFFDVKHLALSLTKLILTSLFFPACGVSKVVTLTAHQSFLGHQSTRNSCMRLPNHTKPIYQIFYHFYSLCKSSFVNNPQNRNCLIWWTMDPGPGMSSAWFAILHTSVPFF